MSELGQHARNVLGDGMSLIAGTELSLRGQPVATMIRRAIQVTLGPLRVSDVGTAVP